MKLSGNTVLITGGASGIGLALTRRFLNAGSEVIICGRRAQKLDEARASYPNLHTRVCDISKPEERETLVAWLQNYFPKLNIVVNNAGIQRRVDLLNALDWKGTQEEIAINLEAPIHLSSLCVPLLSRQNNPAIINVTSGLSFSPLAVVPVYCATKAALHSFTLSLRYQLKKTQIKVYEIIPPAVNTDLGGVGLHTFGVNVDEFTDSVMKGLESDNFEISYGMSERVSQVGKEQFDAIFKQMNM